MPTAFDRAVRHALQKDPDKRFASAGELAAALEAAAGGAQARTFEETRARAGPAPVSGPPDTRTPTAPATVAPPRPGGRLRRARPPLVSAATDPFNLVVLVALLVIGVALGTPWLMAAMAAGVYAAGVAVSYRAARSGRRHG
jgi:hypothetical protein